MISKLLPAETKVQDAKTGTIEYIVSDESVDRQGDIVRLKGWRFDQMPKNAPLIDSHRYGSLEHQLGKVLDARLDNGRLVETAQWAVDVLANRLAQLGFAMTQAGYLKGCSPGFFPVKVLTQMNPEDWPGSWERAQVAYAGTRVGKGLWEQQQRELGDKISGAQTIYLEQQQHELSVCILGANANATVKSLAQAHKAGVLSEADLEFLSIEYARRETADSTVDPAGVEKARQRARTVFWMELNNKINRL